MRKDIDITKLIINPENYRFDPVETQAQAIELMLEKKGDEIFNLAKHILEHGLDKSKSLRVLEIKKDLYKILEGNRRITAIKCLQDPSLIKSDSLKSKFIKLIEDAKSEKREIPKNISCFVYKTEEEASIWIRLDHTGKNEGAGLDDWGVAEKNRFDYRFGKKLSPAMQAVKLYEEITRSKIDDPNELKLSTINRILSNTEARSYLGLGMTNEQVYPVTSLREVGERLDKLFNKMIIEDIPVKEVYDSDLIVKFVKRLYGEKPKPSKKLIKLPFGRSKKTKKYSKKRLPKSNDRKILIPDTCDLEIQEHKINNIYHELMELSLDQFTNAGAVLFRVFLEVSLDDYAEKYGMQFNEDIGISGKITKITEDLEKRAVANSNQLKNIRNVATKKSSILSIENFHEYVHSSRNQPIPIDLIYTWGNLQEFFEILWEEIAKKERKKRK